MKSRKASSLINNGALAGLALGLALLLLVSAGLAAACPVHGAEPTVSVDEAAYVELDYYGAVQRVDVVKSCSFNGLCELRDYGSYLSVQNMSGYDQPKLTEDGLLWKFPATPKERFYYSCQIKTESLALPWSVDISYSLNGKPTKAEALAGAAGLVEIQIHITPNEDIPDYFRNNMILTATSLTDTATAYSLDAPGAQLQSLGSYKAALFFALPGQEDTFVMRIGTDSFETAGVILTVMPATTDQLSMIKDMKEAKDTIEDSADAIYNSMNVICDTLEGMRTGIEALHAGAADLEEARGTISSGKQQVYDSADLALADVETLNEQLGALLPYFEIGQHMTKDLDAATGRLLSSMGDLGGPMEDMNEELTETQKNLSGLQKELRGFNTQLTSLNNQMAQAYMGLTSPGAINMAQAYVGLPPASPISYSQAQVEAGKIKAATEILKGYNSSADKMIDDMDPMFDILSDLTDIMEELADNADSLDRTLGKYTDDISNLIADGETLTQYMITTLDSSSTFLKSSRDLLKQSEEKLDSGARESLAGMTAVLEQSLDGLGQISVLRGASRTIKTTIDDEIDKFEEENRILYMDADAGLVSLTSPLNVRPASVQIILRTSEISPDSVADSIEDLEQEPEKIGFWARIVNIFKSIGEMIGSLFA